MSVTESETTDSTTIALADVGCAVPDESTVDVYELTDDVLEVVRANGHQTHTFTVELGIFGETAEVTLRDNRCPSSVPSWLEAVVRSEYDVSEVYPGR